MTQSRNKHARLFALTAQIAATLLLSSPLDAHIPDTIQTFTYEEEDYILRRITPSTYPNSLLVHSADGLASYEALIPFDPPTPTQAPLSWVLVTVTIEESQASGKLSQSLVDAYLRNRKLKRRLSLSLKERLQISFETYQPESQIKLEDQQNKPALRHYFNARNWQPDSGPSSYTDRPGPLEGKHTTLYFNAAQWESLLAHQQLALDAQIRLGTEGHLADHIGHATLLSAIGRPFFVIKHWIDNELHASYHLDANKTYTFESTVRAKVSIRIEYHYNNMSISEHID